MELSALHAVWGRRLWVSYLLMATPAAGFCALLGAVALFAQGVEDIGPIETPELSLQVRAVTLFAVFMWPLVWTGGWLFAHRFDLPGWRLLPFAMNLLPICMLLIVGAAQIIGQEEAWVMIYLAFLAGLLLLGMLCAALHQDAKAKPA